MSTFAERLAGDRKNLVLWVAIQGIETVFSERAIDVDDTLGEARPMSVCIPARGIDQGESFIDLEALSEKGGSLRVRLKQLRGTTTLVDTFQTLRRRRTFLTANASKTDTTFTVQSTAGFTAPGVFYAGAETIAFTGLTSTTFTGCTRGKYGSRAQKHLGNSGEGTAIYDVAPAFLGRRVKLYGSFLNARGATTAALTSLLGTFSIEASPRFTDSTTVEVECGPLIDEYMNRRVGIGLKEVACDNRPDILSIGLGVNPRLADDGISLRFYVVDASQFIPSAATNPFRSYALFKDANGVGFIGRVVGADDTVDPGYVDVRAQGFLEPDGDGAALQSTVKHMVLVGGALGTSILEVLTSIAGDEDNGAFDVLPGRERDAFSEDGWRFGAGIDEDDVDVASISTVNTQLWCYPIDEAATVGDLMKEWALLSDAFVYVKADGQLSAGTATETDAGSALTIDASMLIATSPPTTHVDETSIAPVVEIAANWNPLTGRHEYKQTSVDGEMLKRYSQFEGAKQYEFKGLGVNVPPRSSSVQQFIRPRTMTEPELAELGRRLQKSDARGRLICEVSCSLKALGVGLGSIVTPDFDAPNHRGGSIRGSVARVIARRPNYDDGRVDLTLQILERLFVFAPSAVVTSVFTTSIANDTVLLDNTGRDGSALSPGNGFGIGTSARLWDVSAGTSQVLVVAAATATTLQFSTGITGTVELNRDWLTWDARGVNDTVTSVGGNDEDDLMFFEPEPLTDPDGDAVRRWR